MRPKPFSLGNTNVQRRKTGRRLRRFNEAQAFQPGKLPRMSSEEYAVARCFNEAQAFQPGKPDQTFDAVAIASNASMRPKPFSLGNVSLLPRSGAWTLWLQ